MSYIKNFQIHSPKILEPRRLLVLSDLHIGKNSEDHMNELIKELKNKDDIDLIVMPGDIIHSESYLNSRIFQNHLLDQIHDLTRDIPTFICAGNHDQMTREGFERWRKENYKRLKELLSKLKNVTFLDNQLIRYHELEIADLTPSINYYLVHREKPRALIHEYNNIKKNYHFSKKYYSILLSHDPISLLKIAHSPKGNLVPGADLVISGHTHEGLVPYGLQNKTNRGLISPSFTTLPKYSMGSYKCGKTIYIINGAINPFPENTIINNMLGINYTLIDLDNDPKLSYKRVL